ncbi:hypothetical protein [Microcoleus sp. bin38.metabat.b11b12b14.051]|uniref:hypothetical protein n=1 Tax=Microcoleus sp. bin38.metabat.b11b12b14.051 TaxID=2742709 RepID=UPI0025E2C599|nr:hypothetical protein [Microcoleus sp. bin38.metabat.b11b12b14.051]
MWGNEVDVMYKVEGRMNPIKNIAVPAVNYSACRERSPFAIEIVGVMRAQLTLVTL